MGSNYYSVRNCLHIPRDIQCALDILELYKKNVLDKELTSHPLSFQQMMNLSEQKFGIDELKDYLIDRAYEAPIHILIANFAYKMNMNAALSGNSPELYRLYCNMRDAAEDVEFHFL